MEIDSCVLPPPSSCIVAEAQNRCDVGIIPGLCVTRATGMVMRTLTESAPINMRMPLGHGRYLSEILRYSEHDKDDLCLDGPDESEADDIRYMVMDKMASAYPFDSDDVRMVDATGLETARHIMQTMGEFDTNRERRFYLCCVIDHFHDVAIRASMHFSDAVKLAATWEAKGSLSEQERQAWLDKLEYDSDDSICNLYSYSMMQRVMLELHHMGLTYGRPNWLYGLPDAIQYDHVDYFDELNRDVFADMWTRLQMNHVPDVVDSLWGERTERGETLRRAQQLCVERSALVQLAHPLPAALPHELDVVTEAPPPAPFVHAKSAEARTLCKVDLACAGEDGVSPSATATILTEKVPVNMRFVLSSSGRSLAEVLCYSEQDSLDTVLDDPSMRSLIVAECAEEIYGDIGTTKELKLCMQDDEIVCLAKDITNSLDPVNPWLACNRNRRFYLCKILNGFRDAAVDAYGVFSDALRRAAELDSREWPAPELEAWTAELDATNDDLTERVNRYQMAHRVMLELHNFAFLYKRPKWLVGLPESLEYDHAKYFGVATRDTYKKLWSRFKEMDESAIDEHLWSDTEDVVTMLDMLEHS
ncbi:hypothetical protein CYMTET_47232 [Cymbomonas tetramitiformis]|uniref:Uncharacterized protein n=1 Tax=Cymbomonas tetramitiformis TaxID=36881 RepID=A0AAE0BWD5_9CHLO|nr:hypothetical protein CYMTET_47232 [Cymbomonas tetramitiformis]